MSTRILYVITKANWGGAQKYVYDLASVAKDSGYSVCVAYGEPGLLSKRLEEIGIRTIFLPNLQRNIRLWKDFLAYRELKNLFEKETPDVVHLNSSKAGYLGALAARACGVRKIIFTAHGWAFTEPRNVLSRQTLKWLQYQTALLATKVIAVSEFVFHAVDRWQLPSGRRELIRLAIRKPNYLTKEKAREALIHLHPELEKVKDNLWIGTIAELHKNKGLDIGIQGWQKAALPDAEWIVIGEGEEKTKLSELVRQSPTIHLLGFIADAAQYLPAFDLFLLPSRTEALGYVLLEAGLAGVPILTNGIGGTSEVVEPKSNIGFFEPGDPLSLATMLLLISNNSENLKQIGENLRRYTEEKFSFEKMINKTLELYC